MARQCALRLLFVILSIVCVTTAFAEKGIKCGTQEAFERFQRGDKLTRPPNGPKYIYSPHFIIHFDTTGAHACTRAYAESTSIYAEFSWAKQIGGLGWAATPPDIGGPDSRYDIYIQNIPYYGVTYVESPYPTPYPTGFTTYIVLDNNMSWDDLCATTAHEFNHGCQIRYSVQYNWWYENVATWMEDVCYDHVNWYIYCLYTSPNPLADPNLSITETSNMYAYAGYLWARFLHEYYSITCLRLIWEEIGQMGGNSTLMAIDSILQCYDSDLKMALGAYAVWRYFTGNRADTIGHFSESHFWPTSYVDPNHQHNGSGSGNQGTRYIDGPGGTSYIEFYTTPDYLLKNSFTGGTNGKWQAWHIGYTPPTGHMHYMMDSVDFWSILPTMWHDTIVFTPVATNLAASGLIYSYSGIGISSTPSPPQDPELEVYSILSPTDTISQYTTITPLSVIRNNCTDPTDSTWVSFYVGDFYSDSREIGQLGPGQTDTVSFADWTALERNSYGARCIAGGSYDVDRTNNCCDTSINVPLSDVEVLEILSPRGVIAQNMAVEPRVLLRNNGTSGANVSVSFSVQNYTYTTSIYLEPDSSGELSFADWTPVELGACTTNCLITTPDDRACNDNLIGEVLVDSSTSLEENQMQRVTQFILRVNPNPSRHHTDIRYEIPNVVDSRQYAVGSIRIYDIVGRLVKNFSVLTAYSLMPNVIPWDGRDDQNRKLPSGVYFVTLKAEDYGATEKLLLIR